MAMATLVDTSLIRVHRGIRYLTKPCGAMARTVITALNHPSSKISPQDSAHMTRCSAVTPIRWHGVLPCTAGRSVPRSKRKKNDAVSCPLKYPRKPCTYAIDRLEFIKAARGDIAVGRNCHVGQCAARTQFQKRLGTRLYAGLQT